MKKHYATIFIDTGQDEYCWSLYVSNYKRNLPSSSSILTMYRISFVFF